MDLVNRQYDEAIHNIIKVYLAQMDSAMKISKIICEHSDDDEENYWNDLTSSEKKVQYTHESTKHIHLKHHDFTCWCNSSSYCN